MANNYSTDIERSSTQYWSITDAAQTGLGITGDLTFAMWVKPESFNTSASAGLIAKNSGTLDANGYSYVWRINTDGGGATSLQFVGANAGIADGITFTTTISTGSYTFIAIKYTSASGTVKQWVGSSTSSGSFPTVRTLNNSNVPFYIGKDNGSGDDSRLYDGLINEVLVYNAALADATIDALRTDPCNPSTTNLVSRWFAENNNANDLQGANNLTGTNSPTFSTDVAFTCGVTARKPFGALSLMGAGQ